jgi:hypothetical protein
MHIGKRRADVMGTTADAQPDPPREAAPSTGKRPHLAEVLARLAGGSAVDGPYGLLAVEEERLAAEEAEA